MIIQNPWVGYLDRNYQLIKSRILTRMGETITEMTDHSDSNILVVAIEAFAGVGEQLNYYIDSMAREAFVTTSRRYSSVVKHTRLIDYRIKSMIPASADITVEFLNNDDTPYTVGPAIVPSGTIFKTANNVEFITLEDTNITGKSIATFVTKQKTLVEDDILGITSNLPDQVFSLGKSYVFDSVELEVGPDVWLLQKTLGLSGPLDKHFIVEVSAAKEAYIRFGDNINGLIPTPGLSVKADYYTSLGSLGNVEAGNIINTDYDFNAQHGIPKNKIYNQYKAVAGTDFESIERIRRSAPLSLRTLDRAVTRQDYIDIALLAPGVDKANLFFECGKYVYLYIAPNGGGLASNGLLQDVVDWFDDKKMVTTFVKALPAGESQLFFDLTVKAKFRVDPIQLKQDLIDLLLDAYSYEKSDINKATRVSDLIALVDNHPKVNYLRLNNIYLKPYIRPLANINEALIEPLNYDITLNEGSTTTHSWKIKFDGTYFIIFKDNFQVSNLPISTPFTDLGNVITITINPGAYIAGMEWKFKTLPIRDDIVLDDYSVPVLSEDNLIITVNQQLAL